MVIARKASQTKTIGWPMGAVVALMARAHHLREGLEGRCDLSKDSRPVAAWSAAYPADGLLGMDDNRDGGGH